MPTGVISGCVSEDMNMIRQADALVAFLDRDEQNGTLVEIMHAVGAGMPALVILHPDQAAVGPHPEDADASESDRGEAVVRPLSPVEWNATAGSHWFLINYLLGDPKDVWEERIRENVPMDVPEWSGVPRAQVWVADEGSVGDLIRLWAERIDVSDTDE